MSQNVEYIMLFIYFNIVEKISVLTMEKLVFNQLYDYFIKNDMLTNSQHGFRPNHSTVTQCWKLRTNGFITLISAN